ncbi:hypothetical protein QFZ56_002399 [Streptomyces achromogenes]|uniref:Uncharacterized protein n=1 Tax=Streptomyces achromogenes TaxID=67255 RepID=A0ABU0PYE5_STRAH|nr:hypothetical protein [Streptomyces achromogenes]MDQ0683436.1 hypothetical protein [Streptomyces achromogenes]
MSLPIRIPRRAAGQAAVVAAVFTTAVFTSGVTPAVAPAVVPAVAPAVAPAVVSADAPAAVPAAVADEGSGRVAMRFETVETYVMYSADEGAGASNDGFVVPVYVQASKGGEPARNVRVVVDASGLAGVARVGDTHMCEAEGPVFTCVYGDLQNGDGESYSPLSLRGVDGVEPGDSGTVTYTATADNAPAVTGTTRMTVGGPRLSAPGQEKNVSGLAPGKSAHVTPRLANHTRFPANQGVALKVDASEGLTLSALHSNCFYAGSAPTSAWCTFPTKAAPGAAYAADAPLVYTVTGPRTLTGEVTYTWSSAPSRPAGHPVRGVGPPLGLVRTPARGIGDGQGRVAVTTDVQVDYRPVTATVRGRVGDTVHVRLGLEDLGPGRMTGDEEPGRFEVVPPEGTTVTSVPFRFEEDGGKWACDRPEKPGGAFVCEIGRDQFYEVRHEGGTTAIDFHIRIDRQVAGARGTIRTVNPYDRTPANDVAVIPLDASPAPPYRYAWAWAAGALAVVLLAAVRLRRRRRAAPS